MFTFLKNKTTKVPPVKSLSIPLNSIDIVHYNKEYDVSIYVTINKVFTFKLDLNGTDTVYTISPDTNGTNNLVMVKHNASISEYSEDIEVSNEDDIIPDEDIVQKPIVYKSNITVNIKNVGVLLEYFITKDIKYSVDKVCPKMVNIQAELDMENISNIVFELSDSCIEIVSKQCIREIYDGYITDEDLEYLLAKYRSTKQERLKNLVKKHSPK
jgi:hypothetical protein